jgi:hypothetical protein
MNILRPSYCTRDGHCLRCDLSHECTDCAGHAFAYCGDCGDILGDNPDTCRSCWEAAFPDHCWECGERLGEGYANRCRTCEEYLKD